LYSRLCCRRKWSIATERLDAEERRFILDRMRPLSFDPRAILFDQGEPSDTFVLPTEGRVRLYQTLESGEQFTFGLCIAGAILGLAALVTREPRILSAVALEPVTASVMTRTDFMNCLNMVPRFHWNITRLVGIPKAILRPSPVPAQDSAGRLRPKQGRKV